MRLIMPIKSIRQVKLISFFQIFNSQLNVKIEKYLSTKSRILSVRCLMLGRFPWFIPTFRTGNAFHLLGLAAGSSFAGLGDDRTAPPIPDLPTSRAAPGTTRQTIRALFHANSLTGSRRRLNGAGSRIKPLAKETPLPPAADRRNRKSPDPLRVSRREPGYNRSRPRRPEHPRPSPRRHRWDCRPP